MQLPILYQDDHFVAINKPSGLLVHRSPIDKYETHFALQILRDQLGKRVYPIHRLDKPTSGVLLFALSAEMASQISQQWQAVTKRYFAITRGELTSTCVDNPIKTIENSGREKIQHAVTELTNLNTFQLPVAFGRQAEQYSYTKFSLVEACLQTGRKHQIRKHLKHVNHPIIGDTRYGKGDINRYFRNHYGIDRLMLHCHTLCFHHSLSNELINVYAPVDSAWLKLLPLVK